MSYFTSFPKFTSIFLPSIYIHFTLLKCLSKNVLLILTLLQHCTLKLRNWLSTAPYQPDSNYNEDTEYATDNENSHGCRVMSCSFLPDRNLASFFAMLDADGQIVDFLRLKHLLFRWNGYRESERKNKVKI